MGAYLISDYKTLVSAEIIAIIVWHNQQNGGFPSENDTSYFRLYITITSIIHVLYPLGLLYLLYEQNYVY
jgi:hypothetical protein